MDKFLEASKLYGKVGNVFDASYTLFKAADFSFGRGCDRFGLGALEYALDCHKAAGKEKDRKAVELKKKIKELKEKLSKK